ncbi:hypothetical protein SELMODRAFT_136751, partial [Selaginella moellendorffii]
LAGAHTVGTSKCSTFANGRFDRIYNFKNTSKPDETVNPEYWPYLRKKCPLGGDFTANTVEFDRGSQFNFDNWYFKSFEKRNGLLTSDQDLFESQFTSGLVKFYGNNPDKFAWDFGHSMIKMRNIGWKTRENGEIRIM